MNWSWAGHGLHRQEQVGNAVGIDQEGEITWEMGWVLLKAVLFLEENHGTSWKLMENHGASTSFGENLRQLTRSLELAAQVSGAVNLIDVKSDDGIQAPSIRDLQNSQTLEGMGKKIQKTTWSQDFFLRLWQAHSFFNMGFGRLLTSNPYPHDSFFLGVPSGKLT